MKKKFSEITVNESFTFNGLEFTKYDANNGLNQRYGLFYFKPDHVLDTNKEPIFNSDSTLMQIITITPLVVIFGLAVYLFVRMLLI